MPSGRSGSASGASDAQVTIAGRAPPGCASSRKRPRRSSQSRSTRAGRGRGATQCLQRERPERVDQGLAEDGAAAVAYAAGVEAEAAIAVDEEREADPRVRPPPPDRVELGRGVEARLVRLEDPEQAVPVEVAICHQPIGLGGDPRLGARVADGDLPGPGQQRRLDRPGLARAWRGDVVEGQAAQRDRAVPEDRVADEAVGLLGGEQGFQLNPRALRLEAPPDDRGEAGIPVPLPRIATRAGAGVRKRRALALPLEPVPPQHPLRNLSRRRDRKRRNRSL